MTEWETARDSRAGKIDVLKKLIPNYDYSGEETAHRTDDMFSAVLTENLRTAKNDLFNILNTAYELHKEVLLNDFQSLRDEIDTFYNEIKARAFKWDRSKSSRWLMMLIDYDYKILTSLGNLLSGIKALHKHLLESPPGVKGLKGLDSLTSDLKKRLREIIIMFREREAVCNIKDAALDDEFARIRTRIRKSL